MTIRTTPALAWLTAAVLFGLGVFDAPGDGGGGGAAGGAAGTGTADTGGGGAAHGADGAEGGADDGAAARPADADADPDDDRYPDPDDDVDSLPEPQARTRLRRTQRFAAKVRPLADRFRDPATGRLMTTDQVDAILSGHREYQQLDQVLKLSPRAVQVLVEEQQRLERGETGAAAGGDAEPEPFNEAEWPFEVETPQGRMLLQMAKDQHDQKTVIARLRNELGGVKSGVEKQTVSAIEGQWKSLAFKAADEVDPTYRPLFIRNIRREFQQLQNSGRLTKANAKDVIDAELREVRAAKKSTQRTTVTAQSATAAGNRNLPRTPRPGTTVPATGRPASDKRETIKDASKSFLSRYR